MVKWGSQPTLGVGMALMVMGLASSINCSIGQEIRTGSPRFSVTTSDTPSKTFDPESQAYWEGVGWFGLPFVGLFLLYVLLLLGYLCSTACKCILRAICCCCCKKQRKRGKAPLDVFMSRYKRMRYLLLLLAAAGVIGGIVASSGNSSVSNTVDALFTIPQNSIDRFQVIYNTLESSADAVAATNPVVTLDDNVLSDFSKEIDDMDDLLNAPKDAVHTANDTRETVFFVIIVISCLGFAGIGISGILHKRLFIRALNLPMLFIGSIISLLVAVHLPIAVIIGDMCGLVTLYKDPSATIPSPFESIRECAIGDVITNLFDEVEGVRDQNADVLITYMDTAYSYTASVLLVKGTELWIVDMETAAGSDSVVDANAASLRSLNAFLSIESSVDVCEVVDLFVDDVDTRVCSSTLSTLDWMWCGLGAMSLITSLVFFVGIRTQGLIKKRAGYVDGNGKWVSDDLAAAGVVSKPIGGNTDSIQMAPAALPRLPPIRPVVPHQRPKPMGHVMSAKGA